jgi:phenylpyruvate tautomerase PptA (4-oxalocrotonate tautomerase family)
MPLVRIDVLEGRPDEELETIGAVVHEVMVEVLGVPERDDFRIVTEHRPGRLHFDRHYLEMDRSDAWVLVRVTLSAGRTTEAKQRFYSLVAERLADRVGLRPDDLTVILVENRREDWSFGGGEANYLTLDPDDWR